MPRAPTCQRRPADGVALVDQVGDGPVLLVVENDDTFHSIRTVLADDPGPVGYVAWGAGAAFEASVRSTGDLPGVERVRYFGDLDAAGLRISRSAGETASCEELPPAAAAQRLYSALLESGVRQGGQPVVPSQHAATLADWLGDPSLTTQVAQLLVSGVRIPQEALALTILAVDRSWLENM